MKLECKCWKRDGDGVTILRRCKPACQCTCHGFPPPKRSEPYTPDPCAPRRPPKEPWDLPWEKRYPPLPDYPKPRYHGAP